MVAQRIASDAQQPRCVARHRRAQRDRFGGKVKIERVDAHQGAGVTGAATGGITSGTRGALAPSLSIHA